MINENNNIFAGIPNDLQVEIFQTIVQSKNIKIERIISKGQRSEDGFWYDQDKSEFVIVLQGVARLQFENKTVELNAGDYITIEAHKKHRVEWTKPDEETIWLAVFY